MNEKRKCIHIYIYIYTRSYARAHFFHLFMSWILVTNGELSTCTFNGVGWAGRLGCWLRRLAGPYSWVGWLSRTTGLSSWLSRTAGPVGGAAPQGQLAKPNGWAGSWPGRLGCTAGLIRMAGMPGRDAGLAGYAVRPGRSQGRDFNSPAPPLSQLGWLVEPYS